MTTMNGAAQAVAAADQVVFDARHGVVDNEALIYALPADQVGAALPLYLRFKQAAEEKKEDVAREQYDRLVHQQEKSEDELEKEHEHQQLMEYRAEMAESLRHTKQATAELDNKLHALQEKHDESEILVDGREVVLSDDKKSFVYADTGEKLKDEAKKRDAERQAAENDWHVRTLSQDRALHQDMSQAQNANADARAACAQVEKGQNKELSSEEQKNNRELIATTSHGVETSSKKIQSDLDNAEGQKMDPTKLDTGSNSDLSDFGDNPIKTDVKLNASFTGAANNSSPATNNSPAYTPAPAKVSSVPQI